MKLKESSYALLRLLRGERLYKPPFWEPWFAMEGFFRRRYGDPDRIENRIKMARDLDMAAVKLGTIDINADFTVRKVVSDGSNRYSGGLLRNIKQLKEREMPDWSGIVEKWKTEQQIIKDAGLLSWVTLPWCFHVIATSMGYSNFAVKLYRDFKFVDAAFEWVEERNRRAIDEVIREVRPDFVLFDGDCAYKKGLMVNPRIFRKLVFNRTEETVSHLRSLDIPYVFHTDGKLDDVIPLLVELGFSAVHGCEKKANDLKHLVDTFGDDIVLVGNMDVVFLSRATPEEVEKETEEMLRIGSSRGRFVAACNTSPLDYIPEENYLTMVRTIKSFKPHGQK